ncbi:MAG: hypothetical protein Q9207_005081 [Kuettlingeria erythrocarpa]
MHSFSSIVILLGLAPLAFAGYSLKDDYSGDRFFDMFTFDTMDDPTHGYVNYVDQGTAQNRGLIDKSDGAVVMRVDSSNVASGRGRDSVRLTSKASYNHALVVVDLAHMPGNACGIWPAFWTVGPNWPSNGEIDIIEGVNMQSSNQATMHTNDGCSFADASPSSCGSSGSNNQGCPIKGGAFGDSFNPGNGGTYAMEWTGRGIYVWYFARGQEPQDVLGDSPKPKQWGEPTATFQGGTNCNIDQFFKDQQIIFDTTFCGDWAGQTWSQDPKCSAKASTCQEYVQNNPRAFTEAYWKINALKVYSKDGSEDQEQSSQPVEPLPAEEPQQPVEPVPAEQPRQAVQVITQVVQGPAVTMTIYQRSPTPTPAIVEAPVELMRKDALFEAQRGDPAGSSELGRRRRSRPRPRRHLAEHVRSAAGQHP